jgi:GNAT superfamily N-acetyltransferase
MTIAIRSATPEDQTQWCGLWDAYLRYYKVDLAPEITSRTWQRVMDLELPLQGRFAFEGDRMLGFALHLHHASTWVLGDDCYLEDLFVDEAARGQGVGRALIDDLIAIARKNGWHRLYWHTEETNTRARALYDSYVHSDGHIRYRLRL